MFSPNDSCRSTNTFFSTENNKEACSYATNNTSQVSAESVGSQSSASSLSKSVMLVVGSVVLFGAAAFASSSAYAASFNKSNGQTQDTLSREEIIEFTGKCEKSHDLDACNTLGMHYATLAIDHSKDIEVNMKLAAYNLEKACSGGHTKSCNILGQAMGLYGTYFIDERAPQINYELGSDLLHQGCDLGDPFSCAQLGTLYRDGKGIAKDNDTAMGLFVRSCDLAQEKPDNVKKLESNLGLGCYYAGQMIHSNLAKNPNASELDKSDGFRYFDVACSLNSPEACLDLATYYAQLKQGEKAVHYSKKACLAGHADVCFQNALQLHTAGDDQNANYFLDIGCQMGNGDACTLLATHILSGIAIEQDANTALQMLNKSCDVGNGLACTFLGQLYLTGGKDTPNYKTEINLNLSAAYFGKACKLGVSNGCEGAAHVNQLMLQAPAH